MYNFECVAFITLLKCTLSKEVTRKTNSKDIYLKNRCKIYAHLKTIIQQKDNVDEEKNQA